MDETTPTTRAAVLRMFDVIRMSRSARLWVIALVVVVVGGIVAATVWLRSPDDPQQSALRETERLVAAVGKLVVLPADESPIIATVTNPDELRSQPFFAHAQKGDKVLIYNKAKKAILYSPSANRVTDIAPLNTSPTTPTPSTKR